MFHYLFIFTTNFGGGVTCLYGAWDESRHLRSADLHFEDNSSCQKVLTSAGLDCERRWDERDGARSAPAFCAVTVWIFFF